MMMAAPDLLDEPLSSTLEQRMSLMRERFKLLSNFHEDIELGGVNDDTDSNKADIDSQPSLSRSSSIAQSIPSTASSKATNRWDRLRGAIRGFPKEVRKKNVVPLGSAESLEAENEKMSHYWENFHIPEPILSTADVELGLFAPPDVAALEEEFVHDVIPLELEVTKVPQSILVEEQNRVAEVLFNERRKAAEIMMNKESDILWREHLARQRVQQLEQEAKDRIDNEKQKIAQINLEKEISMGRMFKKARENIEEFLKFQNSHILERFGEIVTDHKSISRKLDIFSKTVPQPVEMRIHCLRAVKSKLPKGAYVIMLTQYESLGGKPLWWSQVGPNGIGDASRFPSVTRPIKHYGRYFDRLMKVEDSVFALCPPLSQLRPGFVFVLEVFQLKNRHNPYDKCVAWTAFPMCNEHFGLVQGKLRLPLLRGEHSPACEYFRDMERAMAKDLSIWLCNIYVEVVSFPLSLIEKEYEKMSLYLDLDYFNHDVHAVSDDVKKLAALLRTRGMSSESSKPYLASPNGRAGSWITSGSSKRMPLFLAEDLSVKNVEEKLEHEARSEKKDGNQLASQLSSINNTRMDSSSAKLSIDKGLFHRKSTSSGSSLSLKKRIPTNSSYSSLSMKVENDENDEFDDIFPSSSSSNELGDSSKWKPHHSYWKSWQLWWNSFFPRRFRHQAIVPLERVGDIEEGREGGTMMSKEMEKNHKNEEDAATQSLGQRRGVSFKIQVAPEVSTKSNLVSPRHVQPNLDGFSSPQNKLPVSVDVSDGSVEKRHSPNRSQDQKRELLEGGGEMEMETETEVLERGYELQDHFYLHEEQKGKLAGVECVEEGEGSTWAQSGLEGKIIRRLASEGPRFDSEAIDSPDSPKRLKSNMFSSIIGSSVTVPDVAVNKWKPLTDSIDFDCYSMALAADPSQRRRLLPSAISKSKLKFLYVEIFGDMSTYVWGSVDFYITVLVATIAFFLRIYVHFLSQYLYLQGMSVPLFGFVFTLPTVYFKYVSSSMLEGTEVGEVAIGPLSTCAVFILFATLGKVCYQIAGTVPDSLSKFVALFGFFSMLDPILIAAVDAMMLNFACRTTHQGCQVYTATSCHCYEADFIKLWNRMQKDEGNGIVGLFITLMLYFGTMVVSALLLYYYLVYIHKNARILDIFRRINAPTEEFFIPDDFEISFEELNSICSLAKRWRGLDGSTRVVQVSQVPRNLDSVYPVQDIRHYAIYEVAADRKTWKVHRHFVMTSNGSILEIFDQFQSDSHASYQSSGISAAIQGFLSTENEAFAKEVPLSPSKYSSQINNSKLPSTGTVIEEQPGKIFPDLNKIT